MKRPKSKNRGTREGEESQVKGTENTFNKITGENFPNLKKDIPVKVQEIYKTPHRLDQKRNFLQNIAIRTLNVLNKERILKVIKGKEQVEHIYKVRPI